MTTITLDANVFVTAFDRNDPLQKVCRQLLNLISTGAYPVFSPTLLFPEIAAAFARGSSRPQLAQNFVNEARKLLFIRPVVVDEQLANQAVSLAINSRLRGADAIYVATAVRYRALLITNDGNMLKRVPQLAVMSPMEAFAHFSALDE